MKDLDHIDWTLLALEETTERFEALVDHTGRNSQAFQAECRELGEQIEELKNFSIFR